MAETSTPGTFIPHDTIVAAKSARPRGGGLNDLILLCSIVLFVTSAALGVGVFLYQQYLTQESASKVASLQRAQAAFDPSLVQQITRLDDRMHAADSILGNHVAPTAFFSALAASTLQTVSFETLDLEAPDAQHITIKMQGVAQSVNSIALQADLFSKSGIITSPIFSNIAREPDGVHFDLSAVVDPIAINYGKTLGGASAQNTPVLNAPPASAAPSSVSPFGTAGATQTSQSATTSPGPSGTQ